MSGRKSQNVNGNVRSRTEKVDTNVEQNVFDDLKAFENRLQEIVAYPKTRTRLWRVILGLIATWTVISTMRWLLDPLTQQVTFWESLMNHPAFVLSVLTLIILALTGVHHRIWASSIITTRAKTVLKDFNMSCDASGKLILKPRSGGLA
ncbi:putative Nuclear envelope phosphatase-regulatory subunit 1 [Hypsibius exemplaris]|uniref:Transmembrane protein 188 n=1 Tax=Hypsibius exemplaris TaxID=2072580 RepID=A0A1W0WTJ4_HYPEX|nr:putative Nuclear envelope phosphatase-regulatory subunit 1 [Hypsibius exemplaris]